MSERWTLADYRRHVPRMVAELAELRRERDHAREEWHRQNERADDYRRQLLGETYRPKGGEIVLRELRRTQRERDEALAKISAIEPFLRDEAANDSPEAQRLLLMLASAPETQEQP